MNNNSYNVVGLNLWDSIKSTEEQQKQIAHTITLKGTIIENSECCIVLYSPTKGAIESAYDSMSRIDSVELFSKNCDKFYSLICVKEGY